MQRLELDASGWGEPLDFISALKLAIGAPDWSGNSVAALIDVMIFDGQTQVTPPYRVVITRAHALPADVLEEVFALRSALITAVRYDDRSDVGIEIEQSGSA